MKGLGLDGDLNPVPLRYEAGMSWRFLSAWWFHDVWKGWEAVVCWICCIYHRLLAPANK